MNLNTKVKLKTYGLFYLFLLILSVLIAAIVYKFVRFNFPLVLGITVVADIPVALIVMKILLLKEKKNPISRLHSEFLKEMLENGYSERFFEISDEGIKAHQDGTDKGPIYIRDFVLFRNDYYILEGQYETALSYISLLNEKSYTGKDTLFIDNGLSALMYYSSLIECYHGLKDKENAIKLIERAKPFLDMEHKLDTVAVGALLIYYEYYMTIENYDRAREFIQKLDTYTSKEAESVISRYYCEAEFAIHEGRRQDAVNALKKAEPYISKMGKCGEYLIQKYHERLGLTEEIK